MIDVRIRLHEEHLRGFIGYFEMYLTCGDESFKVTEAKYVTASEGARDVTKAYGHPVLGKKMRETLFDAIAAKDVPKLNEILRTVADAWG